MVVTGDHAKGLQCFPKPHVVAKDAMQIEAIKES